MSYQALIALCKPFMYSDPRTLPSGNWFKQDIVAKVSEGFYKIKRFNPIHVYIPRNDLRLYFWYCKDFEEWFLDYALITGDINGDTVEIYEMYSDRQVKELNKPSDTLPQGGVGDAIVANAYTYHLGNMKWHFVRRSVSVKVELIWHV